MPLIRANGRLIYFAHVPKCAGTSVERYLVARFGPLALADRAYLSVAPAHRWTRSSPQHIPLDAVERLFPPGFFDASFALIRHPVDRLASVFLFQREKQGTIPAGQSFGDWLAAIPAARAADPFCHDNHTRPMTDFVPEDAVLFRLEDGTGAVEAWIDDLCGPQTGPEPATSPRINTRYRRLKDGPPQPPFAVTAGERALVGQLYPQDFERFGYDRD